MCAYVSSSVEEIQLARKRAIPIRKLWLTPNTALDSRHTACTGRYGPCTSCGGGCVALAAYAREREGQVRMNNES